MSFERRGEEPLKEVPLVVLAVFVGAEQGGNRVGSVLADGRLVDLEIDTGDVLPVGSNHLARDDELHGAALELGTPVVDALAAPGERDARIGVVRTETPDHTPAPLGDVLGAPPGPVAPPGELRLERRHAGRSGGLEGLVDRDRPTEIDEERALGPEVDEPGRLRARAAEERPEPTPHGARSFAS